MNSRLISHWVLGLACVGAGVATSGVVSAEDAAATGATTPATDGPTAKKDIGTEAETWELGVAAGMYFADDEHELYGPDVNLPRLGHQPFETATPELVARAGYYVTPTFGVEAEGNVMFAQTTISHSGVTIWGVRAQAILLAPTKNFVPFVTAGAGFLGASSPSSALGSDTDPAVHVGVGAKWYVAEDTAVRFDLRDNFMSGRGKNDYSQNGEALIGMSFVVGRKALPPAPPPPPDSDADGVIDASDACKDDVGPASADVATNGCPPPPDTDADGILDASDACKDQVGPGNTDPTKNGCPPPPDADADGVPDAADKCADVKGDGPDGCLLDTDADGMFDRDDKCPAEAETKNGFEDQDGCADALPEAVQKFTGAIEGIAFEAGKAVIAKSSFAKLDEAAKVLVDFPALRMAISGHTDDSGKAEKNLELSAQRAQAVKDYLVSKGVAAERIETRGAGSTEPAGDNKTKEGRAKNRRIEFKLLQ